MTLWSCYRVFPWVWYKLKLHKILRIWYFTYHSYILRAKYITRKCYKASCIACRFQKVIASKINKLLLQKNCADTTCNFTTVNITSQWIQYINNIILIISLWFSSMRISCFDPVDLGFLPLELLSEILG